MEIHDAWWTPSINMLYIRCGCGALFGHRADKWSVICEHCGSRDNLHKIRERLNMVAKLKKKLAKRVPKEHKFQLEIDYPQITELKEWEDNPRENDEAAEKLAALFEHHGFVSPVVTDENGVLRAGHTRVKAAVQHGYATVPRIVVPFESEEQAQDFAISDNRSSEWATWDKEKLARMFGERAEDQLEETSERTGFAVEEISGLRTVTAEDEDAEDDVENDERLSLSGSSTGGRIIIVYHSPVDRVKLEKLLGISLEAKEGQARRMVFTVDDLDGSAGAVQVKRKTAKKAVLKRKRKVVT